MEEDVQDTPTYIKENGRHVYALYRGDKFVAVGTSAEISEQTGLPKGSLYRICHDTASTEEGVARRYEMFKLEADEEDTF